MSDKVIKAINASMQELNINYAFMRWDRKPVYPYFTGEFLEVPSQSEDGEQETTFILNGFSRGSWSEFLQAKGRIENYFNKAEGKQVIVDGSTMAIFYDSTNVLQTENAEFKRLQINLTIKEWSVK